MAEFTRFNRIATAAVGAIVISTACIAAATAPAVAVQPIDNFAASTVKAPVQAPVPVQANA